MKEQQRRKNYRKKLVSPKEYKVQNTGAQREQKRYSTMKMKVILSSEILRPNRERELLKS